MVQPLSISSAAASACQSFIPVSSAIFFSIFSKYISSLIFYIVSLFYVLIPVSEARYCHLKGSIPQIQSGAIQSGAIPAKAIQSGAVPAKASKLLSFRILPGHISGNLSGTNIRSLQQPDYYSTKKESDRKTIPVSFFIMIFETFLSDPFNMTGRDALSDFKGLEQVRQKREFCQGLTHILSVFRSKS